MHATLYFCLLLFVTNFVGQVDARLKRVNRAVLWKFDLKSFFLCLFAFPFFNSNDKGEGW